MDDIISFNRKFVQDKEYEPYITSKYPDKKVAILTCMDTRLTTLLPQALGLKNGDVKIIKNAGGIISHPFGSAVRSLLIAVYELGVDEIMIIGHTDCGVQHMDSDIIVQHMKERGVLEDDLAMIQYLGIDLHKWLSGFEEVESAVFDSVTLLKKHPLFPKDICIKGFVMDSTTGALKAVNT